jgi:hypothetical protein
MWLNGQEDRTQDVVLWLARLQAGRMLAELGAWAVKLDYQSIGSVLRDWKKAQKRDSQLRGLLTKLKGT